MRIPSSAFAVARYVLAVTVLAGTVVLTSAPKKKEFTVHDKAFYADAATVNFVRPGLVIKILSVDVATDGTIKARYKITDPKGLPLDRDGIVTPGAVSVSLIAAYIPKGQRQYQAYTTRIQGPSPITKLSATQAGADSGGTHDKAAEGEYIYTFRTKLPAGYDKTATHSIGAYGSRNLSEFSLSNDFDSDVYNFVPDGSKVTVTRDVIKTATCNKCHDDLGFHGGSRRGMDMCILCHTPTTNGNVANVDPDTGNTIDMVAMTHRIHAGATLPSVIAGKPYQIIGNAQSVSDWSTVNFPANPRNCVFCHEQNTGAAQKDAFLKPNRAACGSCHDDVNFATGANHVNLPQVSDNECANCHIPRGETEFDASIMGAHTIATRSINAPGVVINILKVENGTKGKKPTVTFTVRDSKGAGIPLASLNRLGVVLAGPTIDYGYTNFGSDVTTNGYVAEDAIRSTCDAGGTCSYTFTHGIPADGWGTYSIGFEARRAQVINAGTKTEVSTTYGAVNKVINFSVDGSGMLPRRQVVDIKKCNGCHDSLQLHGQNRNQIEQCVLCHNPGMTDAPVRPVATNPKDKAAPNQSVNFALMIHKIHTGEGMEEYNRTYVIVGNGGSHNDFGEVRYPVMTKTGGVGAQATRKCYMCHVNGSEQTLPQGLNMVTDPQGLAPMNYPVASACTGCHQGTATMAHAASNTDPKFGESCTVCHGATSEFNINKVHAQ